ncbi:Hypothetical predicted protein [Cloeon dipterum]|uniref:JmjC domain-containing protein n=2 Tax=Cloeon dipterum TaxID=197152 RepID=A0A8S1CSQ8_9INSE|nr:Hypothetical predicted protein [Cloeon dipterum]
MERRQVELRALHRRLLLRTDLSVSDLRAICLPASKHDLPPGHGTRRAICGVVGAFIVLLLAIVLAVPNLQDEILRSAFESRCVVANNFLLMEASRTETDCESVCVGVDAAHELHAPTRAQFAMLAYASRPVVVRGAAADWSALRVFSPAFFRSVYEAYPDAYRAIESDCQFFPFRTEFSTLRDALNMDPDRVSLVPDTKPWYIGWSNCDPRVAEELRRHYQRPEFLPEDISATDWIFMGGPGPGAAMHLDYVSRPSWQAQISGSKTWRLAPPPECEQLCSSFNLTVNKGDIVLIDTNQWYHDTFVNPGELSITIGSEYG